MRYVLFNDDSLTFSKLAAGWLLRFDSRMQVKGFARDLCKAIELTNGVADSEDICDVLSDYRIVPDGHVIDQKSQTAYIFEIEDTNPLSMDKLRKLAQIWFYLDCLHWTFEVFVIDRYLKSWRALPMADIYFSLAFPDPRASKANRKRVQGNVVVDWEETHRSVSRNAIDRPVTC